MKRKLAGMVIVGLMVACAPGCGGSAAPTRAAFITQVSGICHRGHTGVEGAIRAAKGASPAVVRARWFAALQKMSHELERVKAPDDARADYATYESAVREEIAAMTAQTRDSAVDRRQANATHTASALAERLRLGRDC